MTRNSVIARRLPQRESGDGVLPAMSVARNTGLDVAGLLEQVTV